MIVDSSAIVAVLRGEPEQVKFSALLAATPRCRLSAATLLETFIVQGQDRCGEVDELLAAIDAEVVPFDAEQARIARVAHGRFGKGTGSPAQLNFGDCMSYALAKVRGEPLLFKGDDFTHTDIEPAIKG